MNSNKLLRAQRWRGAGYALNERSGRGLIQPVRVQKKSDMLGVGKKKNETLADQWWAKAFDDILRDVNRAHSMEDKS